MNEDKLHNDEYYYCYVFVQQKMMSLFIINGSLSIVSILLKNIQVTRYIQSPIMTSEY
jgi:hypothetical protein